MSYNILLVDDSSIVRKMARRVIALAKIDVGELHEAGNGAEALDVLQRVWIDVVVSDLHMPVMSGMELIEKMGSDPRFEDIPVVVISSDHSETRIEELKRKKGVWAYVKKPFTPEIVRDVLRDLHAVKRVA